MPSFDPAPIKIPCAHFLHGRQVQGHAGLAVTRPADGQVYAELPLADVARVDETVTSARQAFLHADWAR